MNTSELLNELRIERHDREDRGGPGRWPWVAGAVAAAVLVLGGVTWWAWPAQAIEVETVSAIAPAAGSASTAVLQATGYVTARRMATVSAQIIGTLTEVLFEEGDHVEQGQVLARLEDSSQLAQLHAAQAAARAAEARVAHLRTQLSQARRDRDRLAGLAGQGLVSQQLAEQARSGVTGLEAQLRAEQAQAKSAAAQVEVAQVNYDYTVVRAPFAGVITQKTAQVGEIIAPAAAGGGFTRTGVGTIVDMDSLEVEVDVNEAYIARVEAGMPARAVLDAYPDWEIPAHVIAIVPTADRGKATIKVRVALETEDPRVVPNMGVRVSFLEPRPEATADTAPPAGVLLPASAIVRRDGAAYVFLVADGVAREQPVVTAERRYGDFVLVTDGVDAGTEVIDAPPAALEDGSTVVLARSTEQ
ncbi:MAG TPA: efflux RND transporter periplasmic adaptor subunit [Woeseiaceae bacterium]|nr:efflux RND transporter periplasmic adaptor subunit [Woeseiaceae bacterium]